MRESGELCMWGVVRSSFLVRVQISVFVQMLAAGGGGCIFGDICGLSGSGQLLASSFPLR